ncbi:hypothetical protein EWH12_18065 [Sphingobium cupriresistens]|uniref:Uncharacterized protein n=1 Tax=Sphingobium cupriresistens TaxID=1132417 RepID=A0A8G1ZD79_9SPHN|nr:hypothetical protein EWH12_18065 [Sphingobium cupriresistens]
MPEAIRLKLCGNGSFVQHGVVAFLRFGRRHEPQGCVRSGLVAVHPLRLDLAPGVVQRQDPVRF